MHLILNDSKNCGDPSKDPWYLHNLRKTGQLLNPAQVTVGNYYMYKEKYGMVAVVKVLECVFENGWHGFRLMVKRALYSPWPIQPNYVFEAGFYCEAAYPTSWHFEPYLSLIEAPENDPSLNADLKYSGQKN